MAAKKKEFIVAIKDEDDWNSYMLESDKACLRKSIKKNGDLYNDNNSSDSI